MGFNFNLNMDKKRPEKKRRKDSTDIEYEVIYQELGISLNNINSVDPAKFKLVYKSSGKRCLYKPNTKAQLIDAIIYFNKVFPGKPVFDYNWISTVNITDMSGLFNDITTHNFDVSEWDVSNVINMEKMFFNTNFNGDLSEWDVDKVENMRAMFSMSKYDGTLGSIEDWNVSLVKDMYHIFHYTNFHQDLSKWNINDECQKTLTDSVFADNADILNLINAKRRELPANGIKHFRKHKRHILN